MCGVRVGDTGLPVAVADSSNDAVDELLDGAGPAAAPGDGASVALSLVSTQLIDADALGQPQSPGQGDILVQTLLQQALAGQAVGDGAAQAA